ncbi:nucleotide exchange factor GrpE [Acholeplasma hippikon]|uniref:Protein GrpE n=1 Tax=Acholeplasma hippikon TaxID=264636 RepID=A0A449BIM8_9MOLU|nr:nucleotide exchange factor GrpE [Acholeplasma hippikon]VEU82290.1 heat shock protein GrpE [Acholeplasma hippikon]
MKDNKDEIIQDDQIIEETKQEEVKKEESKKEKKSKLEAKIEELENQVKELNDKYLRTLADTENYKKRIDAEKAVMKKYAASSFASELLVPYEQFSKIVEFPTEDPVLKNFLIGFKMIKDQFEQALEREGVKEIQALGKAFDANLHHAIEKESNKEKENGIVLEVLQKGYYFKDRVLRPAMVKVNEWSEENHGENK